MHGLQLYFFAGVTSTSPKFDLYFVFLTMYLILTHCFESPVIFVCSACLSLSYNVLVFLVSTLVTLNKIDVITCNLSVLYILHHKMREIGVYIKFVQRHFV